MAYEARLLDPIPYACVVKLQKRCGKKNCRCWTNNQRHEAYGLKYRSYNEDGSITQHIKHLPKDQVNMVARTIAIRKGMAIWHDLPDDVQWRVAKKCAGKDGDTTFATAYIEAKHPKYLDAK